MERNKTKAIPNGTDYLRNETTNIQYEMPPKKYLTRKKKIKVPWRITSEKRWKIRRAKLPLRGSTSMNDESYKTNCESQNIRESCDSKHRFILQLSECLVIIPLFLLLSFLSLISIFLNVSILPYFHLFHLFLSLHFSKCFQSSKCIHVVFRLISRVPMLWIVW